MKLIEHTDKNEIVEDHRLTSEHTLLFHFNDLLYKIEIKFSGSYESLLEYYKKREDFQMFSHRLNSKYNSPDINHNIIEKINILKDEIIKQEKEMEKSKFLDLCFRECNIKTQVFSNQVGWIEITKKDIQCNYIKKIRSKNDEGKNIMLKPDFFDNKLSEEAIKEATQYFKKIIPTPKRKKIFASF